MSAQPDRKAVIMEATKKVLTPLYANVFEVLQQQVEAGELDLATLNPAFPVPSDVRIAYLDKGVLIEYVSPRIDPKETIRVHTLDAGRESLLGFLGIESTVKMAPRLYLGGPSFNTNFYIGDSIDRLNELEFDWETSNEFSLINGINDLDESDEYSFWSNVTCFWTDATGQLRVRRVDFMEFFPCPGEEYYLPPIEERAIVLLNNIAVLPLPSFDSQLNAELNKLIEVIYLDNTIEPDITSFLDRNSELLELAFGAKRVHSQVLLEWQYESAMPNLKPDFLIERMDGFCDILDFKLPTLKNSPTVGIAQRRHPSYEVDSAIAQLETYETWAAQDVNRRWLQEKHGIKIMHPRRWLVIGMRDSFPDTERQRLRRTRDTEVYTYDEFIALVRYQLYRVR